MQALCVRSAVSDAIIAYLFGYVRSFFRGSYCRGIRGTSLLYIFWSITFLFGQSGKTELLSNVYLYYLYIVLFNWFYKFLATVYILFEKIRNIIDRFLLYTSFHFNCVLFRYTHTHVYCHCFNFYIFVANIFFLLFQILNLRWNDKEFYTACHITS